MMLKIIFVLTLLVSFGMADSQTTSDYFQQTTNYTIDVELNDVKHSLAGTVDIEYYNNAPEALTEIYLHLWPNAYKNKRTAFANQKVENGDNSFKFADFTRLGGFKELDIKVNGKIVAWNYWYDHLDIALVKLAEPLQSGEKITINTQFDLKIPDTFSRLGHVGQSYQMTQWYPKPAVYDKNGWHPMPYLDQGEFYSEFGNFDVTITLAQNYVVGATGSLQTESEKAFLAEKIEATNIKIKQDSLQHKDKALFPPSDTRSKTIRYTAENVHDFAWFADKRFYVQKGAANLPSGKKVDTYVMFTDVQADWWANAIDYVNASVEFYSQKVGEYPYPHATAVQSALSAGAGMEYPMITVIGEEYSAKSLDEVIAHEVGHNWFYGILASNERDHAWMDEGFNSYFEYKYMAHRYGQDAAEEEMEEEYHSPVFRSMNQAINTPSHQLTLDNYWIGAYTNPAYLLNYLEQYLGEVEMQRIMKVYYDTWKFKHPQPSDVKALFEKESGKKLNWFFGDLMNTTKEIDYKASAIQNNGNTYTIKIKNNGTVAAPFSIDVIKDDSIVQQTWVDGFDGEQSVDIVVNDVDQFVIDANSIMPDLKRHNNAINPKGKNLFNQQFKFLGSMKQPDHATTYWTPTFGVNHHNKFMLGFALYNSYNPSKKIEWAIAPMYAFGTNDITGLANVKYHFYPENVQKISLGMGYKRFAYNTNTFYDKVDNANSFFNYQRVRGHLDVALQPKNKRSHLKQQFSLELIALNTQSGGNLADLDTVFLDNNDYLLTGYEGHQSNWTLMPRLTYELSNDKAYNPYKLVARLEQFTGDALLNRNDDYLKLSVTSNMKFLYDAENGIDVRFFGGLFLKNVKSSNTASLTTAAFSLTRYNDTDYWMDDYYFARLSNSGFFSQQVHAADGGFKTITNSNSTAISKKAILSMNLKVDLPMDFPAFFPKIQPYLDAAYLQEEEWELYYQVGLSIAMFKDRLAFYFPFMFLTSDNLTSVGAARPGNYFTKVAFKMDLNQIAPNQFFYNIDF